MTAVTAFGRSLRFANITSWTVSPTTVYVGLAPSTGDRFILAVEPEDVGRWNRDAFDELGGHPLVGRTVMLELLDERIVAMWSPNGSSFVTVPEKRSAPAAVDDGLITAAVEHVNRKRNGIQAPLERCGDGWSTRAWPGEVWSSDDVVKEARRLGFAL